MNWQKVDDYTVFPDPAIPWFIIGFLVVAVLVARFRPAWLLRTWLAVWLLAVAGTLLTLHPSWLRYAPVPTVAEIVFGIGLPTGLTALWLHRSRRHAVLSRAAVQLASALAVFMGGLMIVGIVAESLYAAVG